MCIRDSNQDRNAIVQYLPQATPAVAGAELQQRVKAVVEAAGGTLRSTQAVSYTHLDVYKRQARVYPAGTVGGAGDCCAPSFGGTTAVKCHERSH